MDVVPDGKRVIVFVAPDSTGDSSDVHVTFLLNFFDEIRRRVPVN